MKWIGISSFTTDCAVLRNVRRCGFNLTELAIVLGVAGIILGGVWTIAVQGQESARQSAMKTDLFAITKNVRAFYVSQSGISGASATIMTQLMALSPPPMPGDMLRMNGVQGCTYSNCADHPWGAGTAGATGSLTICGWNPSGGGLGTGACIAIVTGSAQFFSVELTGMPASSCTKAVMINTGADAPTGLYDVAINGTSIVNGSGMTHTLPPVLSQVQTLCVAKPTATIDFVYRLVAPQY